MSNQFNVEPLFKGLGALLTPFQKSLPELDSNEVIRLFECEGALLFRGFNMTPQTLRGFTDIYTEIYASDANRRLTRFDQNVIRNVDPGNNAHELHGEGSFTPGWPELIWFYCVRPPQHSGETTLCDGMALWKSLPFEVKNFFLLNPLRYELEIPFDTKGKVGHGRRQWFFSTPGAGNAYVDWDRGTINLTQIRSAVVEGRMPGTLCFVNHLLANYDPQLTRTTLIDELKIPEKIIDSVKTVSDTLTHEIQWQQGDIAMLDNRRLLHGRRAFDSKDPRDIVIVQSARASFGYGATTRHSINKIGALSLAMGANAPSYAVKLNH